MMQYNNFPCIKGNMFVGRLRDGNKISEPIERDRNEYR